MINAVYCGYFAFLNNKGTCSVGGSLAVGNLSLGSTTRYNYALVQGVSVCERLDAGRLGRAFRCG